MTDLTQRPLIPIGVGPRTVASAPDAESFRATSGTPVAANASADREQEPEPDSPPAVGTPLPATTNTPEVASLDAAIEGLARDAAALRETVAFFEIVGHPDTAQPDDVPLLDKLAREQRARDDAVELTRGLARITTQSALLLVKFTDTAAACLQRFAASGDATQGRRERRRLARWVGVGVGLAGSAAAVSALVLLQARDNARQMDRLQQALVQSIGDGAQAQAAAARTLDTRLRELGSREAAIVAAIQAAPRSVEPEAARREPAKAAASPRNAKRKPAR